MLSRCYPSWYWPKRQNTSTSKSFAPKVLLGKNWCFLSLPGALRSETAFIEIFSDTHTYTSPHCGAGTHSDVLCRHVNTPGPNLRGPRCALTGGSCQRDLPLLLFLPPLSPSAQSLSPSFYLPVLLRTPLPAEASHLLLKVGETFWHGRVTSAATRLCFVTQQHCRSPFQSSSCYCWCLKWMFNSRKQQVRIRVAFFKIDALWDLDPKVSGWTKLGQP